MGNSPSLFFVIILCKRYPHRGTYDVIDFAKWFKVALVWYITVGVRTRWNWKTCMKFMKHARKTTCDLAWAQSGWKLRHHCVLVSQKFDLYKSSDSCELWMNGHLTTVFQLVNIKSIKITKKRMWPKSSINRLKSFEVFCPFQQNLQSPPRPLAGFHSLQCLQFFIN